MTAPRHLPQWALVALTLALFALLGWRTLTVSGPEGGYDGKAYVDYARVLDETGRLPTEAETYEFSIPPLFPLLAVYLERGARRLEAPELVEGTGPSSGWRGSCSSPWACC